MPKNFDWVETEKARVENIEKPWYKPKRRLGHKSESEMRRQRERADTDHRVWQEQGAADLNRKVWGKVLSGEYSVDDFKTLVTEEKFGGSGSMQHRSLLGRNWGEFGGYDTAQWGKFVEADLQKKNKRIEKQLQPGIRNQGNTALQGVMKNASKKTLLGQY